MRGLNTLLRKSNGDAADFLDLPADQWKERVVDGVEVFRDVDVHHLAQPLFRCPSRRA